MVELFDASTGASIGALTDEQFQFLSSHLEEESADDQDYYINQATVDMFATQGADEALITLLQQALNGRDSMDIRWTRPA
jgi:hypothetical protein